MITDIILVVAMVAGGMSTMPMTSPKGSVAVLHTYEARIRLDGRVSTTQVKASDAGQAKNLVQQQFPKATVLSVKKVD